MKDNLMHVCSHKTLNRKFEDVKGVIRRRMSKKNTQHNNQKKRDDRTNTGL